MTDQPPEDPGIELEPFSHVLVEAIEAGSGIKPIIILVHEGRASFTRLGLVRDSSITGSTKRSNGTWIVSRTSPSNNDSPTTPPST